MSVEMMKNIFEEPGQEDPLIDLLQEIGDEVARAESLHAPINSAHEGYSVILEELDEFWEQVRMKRAARDPEKMRRELIETAAMCVRTIRDVVDRDRVSVAG